ncbi:MAG: IS200/IS605 family transposase [Bacteroidia bacterium]|nr:IS200/IS605 family transposase [Bacteroidia bacterium]
MPNSYTQLYIHLVFAVKGRTSLVLESWRQNLEKYLTVVTQSRGHKLLAVYCMPDHTHLLIGLNPNDSISGFVRDLKANSSKWVKEQGFSRFRFEWQTGYGAFSYSLSQRDQVINYIRNQPEHHRRRSFREEYLDLLQKFEVDFKKEYLFEWIDNDGTGTGQDL